MRLTALLLLLVSLIALASDPTHSQIANGANEEREQGKKYYHEGRLQEAVNTLKKAIKRDQGDADAWYFLGLTYVKQRQFKDATKAFETAAKLKPDWAAAHSGLAYSYLTRNKFIDSWRESQRAIELDAKNVEAHYVLGLTKLYTGERNEALKEADIIIGLNERFAGGYLLKSQALVQFAGDVMVRNPEVLPKRPDRYEEAASALEKYLELAPPGLETQGWREQLEALRFHVAIRSPEGKEQHGVYSPRDLTTRARILSKPEPFYTAEARGNGITGTVVLRALLAADGTVKHIVVVWGLPDGLTWESIKAARKIKFTPATLNGRPVSMFIQLEYNFNLY